jgi:hypothetical protein
MTSLTLALGALSLLTLLAVILAMTAFCQARGLTRAVDKRRKTGAAEMESALQALRADLEGLATQIHDLQQLAPPASPAAPPRGGLNLAKRSEALRLHRHGNSVAQIASTLEIPLQEVDLLLKVHRIVIRSL